MKKKRKSLYILAAEGFSKPCKIGVSSSMIKRINLIQANHWLKLHFAYIFEVPENYSPHKVENHIHARLDEYRIRGEWFDIEISEAKVFIEKVLNSCPVEGTKDGAPPF